MSIPGIGSDELSFEYSFSQTVGQTTSKTHTFSDTCTATVLPGGCVKFSMVVEVSKAHVKVGGRVHWGPRGGPVGSSTAGGCLRPRAQALALWPRSPTLLTASPSHPAAPQIPMSLALYGGVGLHHDPAISGVPDDDG